MQLKQKLRTFFLTIPLYINLLFMGCGCGSSRAPAGEATESPSDATLTVTDINFSETVLASEKPVLVDFWAAWCGPCLQMAPTVSRLANAFHGRALVAKLDIDANRTTSLKYDVGAIPTFIVFHKGKVISRFTGTTSFRGLESMLAKPLETQPDAPQKEAGP